MQDQDIYNPYAQVGSLWVPESWVPNSRLEASAGPQGPQPGKSRQQRRYEARQLAKQLAKGG